MAVEDVDVREAQPLQGLVKRGQQVFTGAEVAVRARPHRVAGLGGDDELVAIGGEVFAENPPEGFLGGARDGAVVVREVEVCHAEVEGAQRDRARDGRVVDAPEIVPEAERDLREVQAGAAATGLEGGVGVARVGGGVHARNQAGVDDFSQRENFSQGAGAGGARRQRLAPRFWCALIAQVPQPKPKRRHEMRRRSAHAMEAAPAVPFFASKCFWPKTDMDWPALNNLYLDPEPSRS